MRLQLILMFSALLAAQTKAPATKPKPVGPEPDTWRLDALTVEGNKLYPKDKILAVAGLKIGQAAVKQEFDAARDRLIASGYFESVGYHYDPVPNELAIRGVFEVTEVAQVYPWRLEDVPITRQDFIASISGEPLLSDRIPATDQVTKRLTAKLQQMLTAKHFAEPVVARVLPDKDSEMVIVFRPKANPPSVAEVSFTGCKVWSEPELRKRIASVAIGVVYNESTFRELLDNNVRPLYEIKGYLRVQFTKITTKPVADLHGIAVNVEVVEGDAYKLNSVTVRGTSYSNDEALKIGDFKIGEQINFGEVGQGLEKILTSLKEDGYLKPEVRTRRRITDSDHTCDVFFDIDPGTQYKFGKLLVKGLDIETEPVIRKLWAPKPDDPFKSSYPAYFLQRVREDGIFDNLGETKFDLNVDDAKGVVDVTLTFKGQKPSEKKVDRRRRPL